MHSSSSASSHRIYLLLLLIGFVLFIYWFLSSEPVSKQGLADTSHLPRSSFFTYLNMSSQVYYNEKQGILYVPPHDQPSHFVSMKKHAVRGNHRHTNTDNSILGEVLILLQGHYLFRIGDGSKNIYEDHRYDISKTGILAVQFTADKCHALKNIGKDTNWFASYYIKSKDFIRTTVSVDKEACKDIILT